MALSIPPVDGIESENLQRRIGETLARILYMQAGATKAPMVWERKPASRSVQLQVTQVYSFSKYSHTFSTVDIG